MVVFTVSRPQSCLNITQILLISRELALVVMKFQDWVKVHFNLKAEQTFFKQTCHLFPASYKLEFGVFICSLL